MTQGRDSVANETVSEAEAELKEKVEKKERNEWEGGKHSTCHFE